MAEKERYLKEQFEEEEIPTVWQKSRKEIVMILILVVLWAIFRGTRGQTSIDNIDGFAMAGIILFWFSKSAIAHMKMRSPQLITNPFHSSFSGTIQKFGEWRAVTLGGYKWGPFTQEGGDGTVIFPAQMLLKRGANLDIACSMILIPPGMLPVRLREAFEQRGYRKPYYLGFADEKLFQAVPDLTFMLTEFLATNDYNNRLKNKNKELMLMIEEGRGFYERTFGKSLFDRFKRRDD